MGDHGKQQVWLLGPRASLGEGHGRLLCGIRCHNCWTFMAASNSGHISRSHITLDHAEDNLLELGDDDLDI